MRIKRWINDDVSEKVRSESLALLFLFLNFVFLSAISLTRSNFFYEHVENFNLVKIRLLFLCFIFVILSYGFLLFRKRWNPAKLDVVMLIAIFILAIITPPFLSRDAGAYLLGASNFVWFHVNPYMTGLDAVRNNIWLKELGEIWTLKYPFAYGPIFLMIASLSVLPNFAHLISAVYFYKIIVFIAYACSIFIFYKITKLLSLNKYIVFLYALNPALLINGVVEGHNEVFIILFLLLAIYSMLKKEHFKSAMYWVLSVFIKYNVLIFWPVFWKRDKEFSLKKFLFSFALMITFLFLEVAIFFRWNIFNLVANILIMKEQLQMCIYSCFIAKSAIELLAGPFSGFLQLGLFSLIYFLLFFKFVVQKDDFLRFIFWSFLAMVFILTSWISPWYVLPAMPVGLLIGDEKYKSMVLLLTIYSLVHFFGLL